MGIVRGSIQVVLSLTALAASAADLSIEDIVRLNERAVVVIVGENKDTGAPVQSSGCFVDTAGLILGTAHQVKNVVNLRAKTRDGAQTDAVVVAVDEGREIALLRSAKPPSAIASIGDADALQSGAPLVAISAPENLDFSTLDGIVSSTNRTYRGHPVVQIKLPAAPGASGGPVFNRNGELVGIIIGKLKDQDWATLMNPVNNAYDLLLEQGVAVPGRRPARIVADENGPIRPGEGVAGVELQAMVAYNRGVAATTAEDKIAAYQAATALLPGFYEAWFNLGATYAAQDNLEAAAEAYKEAGTARPEAAEAPHALGRILMKQERFAEAATGLEQAAALAPNDSSLHNDLGEAFRRAGQFDPAAQAFLEALRLKPDYPAACYNLALCYGAMDRNADAAAQFRRYLELAPNAADAAQVKQRIEELEDGKK